MEFSPARMEASVQAMKANYPAFSLGGRPIGTGKLAVWQGWMQPIRGNENIGWILADLAQNRAVTILQGGDVVHNQNCQRTHQELPWFAKLKKPDRAFKIKIIYGGGKRHPRAFVTNPLISPAEHKHMFGDNAVCAYPPWKNVWQWETHTVSDFADQTAIWLIKWNVWQQTGIWLGDEMQHGKMFLYLSISASEQCWCGSGEQYADCHRSVDRKEAFGQLFFSALTKAPRCWMP